MEHQGSKKESGMVGVAVFGAGRMGTVHLGNLAVHPLVKVLWLVDEVTHVAQALLDKLHLQGINICSPTDAQHIYDDPRVGAVCICSPAPCHEETIRCALNAGKHVFCEKPIATSLKAVEECYQIAKDNNVILFCAFNRRFDEQNRRMYDMITAGEIGYIRVVKTSSRDPPAPPQYMESYIKASGGIFFDSSVHDIDLICWLVGEKPVSVYATGSATIAGYAKYGDVDTCAVILRFPGGAVGHIEISRESHMSHDQRTEILGSTGCIQSGNHRRDQLVVSTLQGDVSTAYETLQIIRYANAYRNEMDHFIQHAACNDVSCDVTPESTIMVNSIAKACIESLEKRAEIELHL